MPKPIGVPKSQETVKKPKNLRDVPRYFREVVGGFFHRLFYIIRLVIEANPWIFIAMAFLCILTGITPVIGAHITSALLTAIQELLTQGVVPSGTALADILYDMTSGAFHSVFFLLLFQFLYMFLQRILSRLQSLTNNIAGELVSNHIKIKLMNKAKTVDVSSFDRPEFYEKLENANREASKRPLSILRSTFDVFATVISSISFVVVLANLNVFAPFVIILLALPTAWASLHFRDKSYWYIRHCSTERRKMEYFSSVVTDRDRVKENRIMGLADTFIGVYAENFRKYFSGLRRLLLQEGLVQTLFGALGLFANCAFFLYAAYNVVALGEPIGNYSLYTTALSSISGSVTTLISSMTVIYEGTLFIDNMMIFMKEDVKIRPLLPEAPLFPEKGKPHTVEFRHVYFRYPGAERDVLSDINLKFSPTETVVIVGLNGAGKTTLIKLLTRLYDPTSGEILLDGEDIRRYDVNALYDLFGIIFQDFGKYAVTAKENIYYGDVRNEMSESRVLDAAIRGNADGFIRDLPNGYDTALSRMFEENGVDLSIGQWQKLSIARAFYKESDIMILDEPTASLDPLAEQEVYNQFSELGKNKITVFVSHRLSSATIASLILVMENGRIIESGKHTDLMAAHGRYYELFSTQARRYIGEQNGNADEIGESTV